MGGAQKLKLYTSTVVAQWLNISDSRVRQLRRQGILAEVRPGLYNLKDCVHRYIEYLKRDGSQEEAVDYNAERAKLARAKREKEELELELKRREVIQAADVEKVMVEMLMRFRQKIRNIPVKQSPALAVETDQMEIFLALKRATDEALEELSDFDGLLAEMEEGRANGGTSESGI